MPAKLVRNLPGSRTRIKNAKREFISDALKQTQGNYTEAAKLLGIHPNNLHRLIRSLDLKTTLRSSQQVLWHEPRDSLLINCQATL